MREARRRSSGQADSELVRTLRQELEDTHAKLRKLAEQTCSEKVSSPPPPDIVTLCTVGTAGIWTCECSIYKPHKTSY